LIADRKLEPRKKSAMGNEVVLGIGLYVLGGLAGASFYLPLQRVKKWAWESYWMIYAISGLIVVPWVLALVLSPYLFRVLGHAETETLLLCFAFGAMWGIGGLTWGLMIRYLGVGLGLAIGAGIVASVGTVLPPIFSGTFLPLLHAASGSGVCILAGVGIAAAGIVFVGLAGMNKEKELSAEQKTQGVAEYNFPLGLTLAIFSGLMSCGMPLGIRNGDAIKALTEQIEPNSSVTWRGLPVLVVVLAGGALINITYCLLLNFKNRSAANYRDSGSPLASNYALAAAAGFVWYLQFLLLTIGDGYLGSFAFSGFSILMSSMILFSTIFGILLKEWKGTSAKTRGLLALGLAVLLASVIVIGFGKYLDSKSKQPTASESATPTARHSGRLKGEKEPAAQAAVIQNLVVGD